jgi:DNA-binding MarR family transcriptional regulator
MHSSCLGFFSRRTSRAINGAYDEALAGAGLTACQLTLLAALAAGAGGSLRSLAATVDLEPSTLSRNLALLSRRGLVRLATGSDRREKSIRLTASGQEALAVGFARWREVQQRVHALLAPAELDTLLRLGDRLAEALRPDAR